MSNSQKYISIELLFNSSGSTNLNLSVFSKFFMHWTRTLNTWTKIKNTSSESPPSEPGLLVFSLLLFYFEGLAFPNLVLLLFSTKLTDNTSILIVDY